VAPLTSGLAAAIGGRTLPPPKIAAVDVDRGGSRASQPQEPACRGLRHPCSRRPARHRRLTLDPAVTALFEAARVKVAVASFMQSEAAYRLLWSATR